MRIRVIPATMATALLLLAVKATDVLHGTEALSNSLLISKVAAQQSGDAAPKTDAKPADAAKKTVDKAPDAAADKKTPDATAAKTPEANKDDSKKTEPKKEEAKDAKKAGAKPEA